MDQVGTPFEHSRQIMTTLRAYRDASVLMTFAELGIGDILADGPRTADEVAAQAGTDAAATRRLLEAGVALGLLTREGDAYANTQMAADVLTSDGAASMVNMVRRERAFYERWGRLTEAVVSGERPEANRRQEDAPTWVRDFTLALYDSARLAEPGVSGALAPLIEAIDHPVRLIDVGGGHGGYSIGLARRYPELEAVVFDLPPVIAVTRDIIAAAGVADRVSAVAGDFHKDPLGSDYDVALLFGVLVGEDEAGAQRLLRTVRDALRPGGYVVVRTHGGGPAPDPAERALADLHMLLSTRAGGARGHADTEGWLQAAGFELQPTIPLPPPATGHLLVARVPDGASGVLTVGN